MFNYPWEYVQLPSEVCSTTLGSMFNYPQEYVQLPWGQRYTFEGGKASGHWEAGGKARAKLGATWGQRRNFEGGKASGYWEAGGKVGSKAGANLGATP